MKRRLLAAVAASVLVFGVGWAAAALVDPGTELEAAQACIGEGLTANQATLDILLGGRNLNRSKTQLVNLANQIRGAFECAAAHVAAASAVISTTTTTTAPTTSTVTTTTQPSTTTSSSTTTTSPASCTGTQVTPSTPSIAALVAGSPTGTTFCFAAGVYPRLSIAPRTGQTFIGPDAVLDGEGVTTSAFRADVNDVTIRGFEVKNYTPLEQFGWNEGAITSRWYGAQVAGENWLVEDVDVHHNRGAGVMVSDRSTVRNSLIHHNYAIGLKVYWVDDFALVEGNQIHDNNFDGPPDFNETGGTKFAWTTNLVVRNNVVFDNHGPGLWTDIDNHNTRYEGNVASGNHGPGIVHEVTATIRANVVTNNGHGAQGSPGDSWMWGAGILIANSTGVVIEANEVRLNDSAIGFIHQNRVEDYGSGPHAYQTGGAVNSNVIEGPGWVGAVQDIGQPGYFAGRVAFEGNTYQGSNTWIFGGNELTFAQWQALGHDS